MIYRLVPCKVCGEPVDDVFEARQAAEQRCFRAGCEAAEPEAQLRLL